MIGRPINALLCHVTPSPGIDHIATAVGLVTHRRMIVLPAE